MSWFSDLIGRSRSSVKPSVPKTQVTDPVDRAVQCVGQGAYVLGAGDYHPHTDGGRLIDEPWTRSEFGFGSDCIGFVAHCHRFPRHRPGYNRGGTVVDWVNTDSIMEDGYGAIHSYTGRHVRDATLEIVEPETYPWPGRLIVYAAVRDARNKRIRLGHVGVVEHCSVPPEEWNTGRPNWRAVTVIQCRGPNGARPGVIRSDGAAWSEHDMLWGTADKPWRRSKLLKVR